MDQSITDFIRQIGLPTAALVAIGFGAWRAGGKIYEHFVRPIGGQDGVLAKYFESQAKQYERQGDILERQENAIHDCATESKAHHKESTDFFLRTDLNIVEILEVHRHVINAMSLQFDNEEAVKELIEADQILRRHLERNR